MKELREITAKHPWNLMTTSADKGQFLNILLKLINAKNIMEIGVFIGYSLLAIAMALPDDGKNGSVVALLDEPLRKYVGYYRDFVMELNKALTADPKIEIYQLPIGDGITLCRRIS
ncbi:Caffeoyl-CoA O-methyltransferase [Capsicum chinense]|nr:Caffeoyl-CoA O-methyltransferase [Capsicum chinense]